MEGMQGSGGLMRPEDTVTRQGVFSVLARVLKLEDGDVEELEGFTDRNEIAQWAAPALAAMAEAGYIEGSGESCGLKP
jgi:hypothetical protein